MVLVGRTVHAAGRPAADRAVLRVAQSCRPAAVGVSRGLGREQKGGRHALEVASIGETEE